MLKITGDGRNAALDMRLVDPFADAHGDTTLRRAVQCIRQVWQDTADAWSTTRLQSGEVRELLRQLLKGRCVRPREDAA